MNANDRKGLERLASYMSRPPVAQSRLSRSSDSEDPIYQLKRPFSDGRTAIRFSPFGLLEKLVALVPPKWPNLGCYRGVFAPRHKLRRDIILNPGLASAETVTDPDRVDEEVKSTRRIWSSLLKRTFNLDMDICLDCGGKMKTTSLITKRAVINKILDDIGHSTDPPDHSQRKTRGEFDLSYDDLA